MMTIENAKENISTNIRRLLNQQRLSVYALAKATDEPQNTVYRIVRGENEPRAVLLARIAEALGCTVDDLLAFPQKSRKRA